MQKRRSSHPCGAVTALLALLAFSSVTVRAAEIYVLEAQMERDGRTSVSPTFIVTPGERALLSFDGERELDVAMTLTPRSDTGSTADAADDTGTTGEANGTAGGTGSGAFDLRVELVDGVELFDETVPVSLAETEELVLGGRTIKVLVRVQEPLGQEPASAATPADGG